MCRSTLSRLGTSLFLINLSVLSYGQEQAAPGHLYFSTTPTPVIRSAPSVSATAQPVPLLELPALAADTISQLSQPPYESRVGANRPLPGFGATAGQWWISTDGSKSWSLRIRSSGATGLRLHIKSFDVGTGRLLVFDPNNPSSANTYTAKGPQSTGEFWTTTIFAETLQLEFIPANDASPSLSFLVPEVFHWWTTPHLPASSVSGPRVPESVPTLPPPTGDITCFKDASCYISSTNPYVQLISQSEVYLVFADRTCSGSMVVDRGVTGTPYLLTAGHCVTGEDVTQMESFFQFKTSACTGQNGAFGSLTSVPFPTGTAYPSVAGGTVLASSLKEVPPGSDLIDMTVPDFAFIKLPYKPNVSFYSAGWNPSNSMSTGTVYSITHPRNLPQTFTQGTLTGTPGSYTNYLSFFPSLGLLDRGSSGGGEFNSSAQLVAVVTAMDNMATATTYGCTLPVYGDYFTTFASIYPQISPWLEDTVSPVSFTANPASAPASGVVVTLTWNAPGYSSTAIRIGSPTGTLFTAGGTSGTAATGTWASPGMSFYLLDQTTGYTLSSLTLQPSTSAGAATITASPNPLPAGTNVVTVNWNAPGSSSTLVRIGSATGTIFTSGGATGTAYTGPWASTGMTFYLVDQPTGNALAHVTLLGPSAGTATLIASPNPLPAGTNVVALNWSAPGSSSTLIRVGSPTGTVFTSGGSSGTANTGPWASPGMIFYLINQYTGATITSLTLSSAATPTLAASPDPLPTGTVVTTLTWNAPGPTLIKVGSPTGTLFAAGGATGTATTGPWASSGMKFYLIDQASGATLASVTL
jgi:Trypsin-like peptidase domain